MEDTMEIKIARALEAKRKQNERQGVKPGSGCPFDSSLVPGGENICRETCGRIFPRWSQDPNGYMMLGHPCSELGRKVVVEICREFVKKHLPKEV